MFRSLPLASVLLFVPLALHAQAPAPRLVGTVKAVDGNTIAITTGAGVSGTANVSAETIYLQLPPGSTDLKAGVPSVLGNIAVGDRILVNGKAGDVPTALTAARVIVMKSNDIAARQAMQQADWQKRGTGGLVRAIDGNTLTVGSGAKSLTVTTTPATVFRRYASDSVNFADARPGVLTQIQTGDQISVRGDKSADGTALTAEEVVTGTFQNLSGTIVSTDAAAGTLTLKDLLSKRTVSVKVTGNSDLRKLSAQAAAAFASPKGGAATAGAAPAPAGNNRVTANGTATSGAGGGRFGGDRSGAVAGGPPTRGIAPGTHASNAAGDEPRTVPGGARNAGMDLSRMLPHLPTVTIADLHAGDAVMIVASKANGENLTAITLLSGVEQILSATPSGSQPVTLSPWNLGGPDGGGGA